MSESLTSRERVRRALRGESVDRPALAYLFLGGAHHVLPRVGRRMFEAYGDPDLMAATQMTAAELFGHDSAMQPWGCLTVEAEAFGCQLERPKDYYPQVIGRPLAKEPNLDSLPEPNPFTSGRMPLVLDALTKLRKGAGDDLFIMAMVVSPFLVACELRGMTALLMDFIRDPPFVEGLFERVTRGTERYLEAILETGACDAIFFENAGASRELIGPHHLFQYVLPYHKRLLESVRREAPDVFLIEHNCSETPYFEETLELDIDAISFAYGDVRKIKTEHDWDCRSAHTSPNACLDRYCLHPHGRGQPKAWIGNVDHTKVLLKASPEEVFREARACIESAKAASFVLSTGCEIPFKAPLENIQALGRAVRASS